ncbi:MAG: hypothetical protein AAGB51_09240 [Planctomycetota bacterium]
MARPTLYISLSRSRIEAVLQRSGRVAHASAELDPDRYAEAFGLDLTPLDGALGDLLADLGLPSGARVRLAYQTLDGVSDLFTPSGAGGVTHESMALAIADRVSYVPDANPLAFREVTAGGSAHVLVASDKDHVVAGLDGWLERAGLRAAEIAPFQSWALAQSIETPPETDGPYLVVNLGASTMVLTGYSDGALVFSRVIAAGYDTIIDAIAQLAAKDAQAAPDRDEKVESAQATRESFRAAATDALFGSGIPSREDTLRVGSLLAGQRVLAAIQPSLQRFGVELRQTLRFGFGDSALLRVRLRLDGPGAHIAGLERVLVNQLELEPLPERELSEATANVLSAEYMARTRTTGVGLISSEELEQDRARGFSRALFVGGTAALLLLGGEAGFNWNRSSAAAEELNRVQAQIEDIRAEDERWVDATELAERITRVEDQIGSKVGVIVDWRSTLAEIGAAAKGRVSLSELVGRSDDGMPRIELGGVAFAFEPGARPSESLAGFIASLREAAPFAGVTLGETSAELHEGEPALQFRVTLELRITPGVEVASWD